MFACTCLQNLCRPNALQRTRIFLPTRWMGTHKPKAPPVPKEKKNFALRMRKRTEQEGPKFWEETVGVKPTDDVWRTAKYPPMSYSFPEILGMHREYCAPEMLDNTDSLVIVEAFLDLRTRKKTKFMGTIKKTLLLPHYFNDGLENRIVAFCKTDDDKAAALEAGATYAGGISLIKEVEKGDIKYHDYDYVVCTSDALSDVATIRKYLREHFPNQKAGTLGNDIKALVNHFKHGKPYESTQLEETIGSVKVKLGKLSMTDAELQANLDAYVEAICAHKSRDLGRFILCGRVSVPPSEEVFRLNDRALLPADQRQKEEQARLEQEEEEVVQVDSDDEAEVTRAKSKR